MRPPFELAVWNVRSRHNVGSFFRTSDAAGITHIYLCGITPAPPHSRIEKVSLGAERHVPYSTHAKLAPIIRKKRVDGYACLALELTSKSRSLFSLEKIIKPILLMVGSEVHGLPPNILKLCNRQIHIPMNGAKESLNVSVAFGIAAYALHYR